MGGVWETCERRVAGVWEVCGRHLGGERDEGGSRVRGVDSASATHTGVL